MFRLSLRTVVVLAMLAVAVRPGFGQEWARKMFATTSHDFGTVARGSKAEFRFQFKNLYEEDVRVAAVRSSCGCTTPEVTRRELKTFETSEVVAKFNTQNFLGYRSATVTVTFDKPFYAEVQLQVTGTIRGDVVVHPPFVDLGSVDEGQPVGRRVSVTHSGRSDWQIVDVRSANPHFEVEVLETGRSPSQVAYDLLVQLKNDAPAGYIKDQLFLITNDPRAVQIPLEVQGRVLPDVTVSPQSLALGNLEPGQKVTKNLVVRSKRPFRVLRVECDDPAFSFTLPDGARPVQLVPVTFVAGQQPGKIVRTLRIITDLGTSTAAQVTAQGEVRPSTTAESSRATPAPEAETVGYRGQ